MFDTSVAIAFRDHDDYVLGRASSLDDVAVLPILAVVELEGGVAAAIVDRDKRRASLDRMYALLDIEPFTEREAAVYRQIVTRLGFSRPKVIDRMIAAQSITTGTVLATLNPRDFRDIPELLLEDWTSLASE